MRRPNETDVIENESAFELIELATDELFTLADAFNLIAQACAGEDCEPEIPTPELSVKELH